jgi:Cu(I)/Ag(I) efflux system membrane fusion protein
MDSQERNSTQESNTPKADSKQRPLLWTVGIAVVLAAAIASLLYVANKPSRQSEVGTAAQKEEYYCPMHPAYRSDKPGNCPICGMKLVKLEKKPELIPPGPVQTAVASEPASQPETNTVFIAPERQQMIGMRSVAAVVKPLMKEVSTVGKVAFDETKVTHIHTKVAGYIEQVFADSVGKSVKAGDPLFTIYSPDLLATQNEYLLALKSERVLKGSSFPSVANGAVNLVQATRERLKLWDVTDAEIDRLGEKGVATKAITVYSPISGIITERTAYHHGTYVDPQKDLFTIVDLSTVWVLAEIFEYELPYVRPRQAAEIQMPYAEHSAVLHGLVDFVYPFLDPKTRTAQVRIQFPNRALSLKPDMFTNVRLRINLGNHLVVPQDAVLNTGNEQYVFIDKGAGYVEPRLVKAGPETADFVAIDGGLKTGEKVVTAANFILDSESRLKGAFANMGKPGAKPMGTVQAAAAAPSKITVELLEPAQAKTGANAVRVAVKDANGKPLSGADVEISLHMPQMGSMAPMTAKASLRDAGNGVYAGSIDIPMAWTWQTTVTVRKGNQVLGSTQTNITAR